MKTRRTDQTWITEEFYKIHDVFAFRPNPYQDHFHRRSIATLSIDGPGQGESNVREIWVTLDNFERAGKAALDWLAARPEVDGERVGLYGWSMGSYWGPRVAAYDQRLKACVGARLPPSS